MRVLSIGSDPYIFDPASVSAKRMIGYGEMVERYDILARAPRGQQDIDLSANVHVYALVAKTPLHAILAAIRRFPQLRRAGRWDVVTAQDPFDSGLAGWMLARLLGAAFHVQVHGDFFGSVHWKKERLLNRVLFPLACFLVRRADAVRAVSETVRDGLVMHGVALERIAVSRIAPAHFQITDVEKEQPKRFPTLLWVGRFEKEKNPLLALQAFALAREKDSATMAGQTLGFVGQGTLQGDLQVEIARLGLGDVAFVAPWTNAPFAYYSHATLLLLTSNHEGWGRVVEEAGSVSLPVLMTGVGGAGELVRDGETGFVVPVGDGTAFADKMLHVLADRSSLSRVGNALAEAVHALSDADATKRALFQSWEGARQHFLTTTKPALRRLHTLLCIAFFAHACAFCIFLFRFGTGGGQGWYVLGSDDVGYLQIAKNIWHGVFSQSVTAPLVPDYDRMPLYPLLLSLARFFSLAGVIALQQALSIIGVLAWYATARRLVTPRVAWWSAVLFVIEPTIRFWTTQVATEALFAPFWFGSLYFVGRWYHDRSLRSLVWSGVLLGLAMLTRPIVLFYPLIVGSVLCGVYWRSPWIALRQCIIFICVVGLVVSPWVVRNTVVFGVPSVSLKGSGIQFYENAPTYIMWKMGISREEAVRVLEARLPHPPPIQRPQENALLDAAMTRLVIADPLGYFFVMAKNMIPFFLGDGYASLLATFLPSSPPVAVRWNGTWAQYVHQAWILLRAGGVMSAVYVFGKMVTTSIFVFSLCGVYVAFRAARHRWWVLWLVMTIGYFAMTSGSISYSRYRFPVQPMLFLFAVLGCSWLIQRIYRRSWNDSQL